MNNIPKEKMDEIMSKLAELLGADNLLIVYGGPNQGLKLAMRKDVGIETDALRENAVSIINESCRKISQAEQALGRDQPEQN